MDSTAPFVGIGPAHNAGMAWDFSTDREFAARCETARRKLADVLEAVTAND